jgi:hypothetical protein
MMKLTYQYVDLAVNTDHKNYIHPDKYKRLRCLACNGLAITKTIDSINNPQRHRPVYNITHIQSGLILCSNFATQQEAKNALEKLIALPINWGQNKDNLITEVRAHAQTIKDIRH